MSIEDYVQAIRFTIEPAATSLEVPIRLPGNKTWRHQAQGLHDLDVHAVVLPQEHDEMRRRLLPLRLVPGMSTFALAALINTIVGALEGDAAYLNIGVWHGYSLLAGMLGHTDKTVIGVDNFSARDSPRDVLLQRFEAHRSPRHRFVEADGQTYLSTVHSGPVGFFFYDAGHSHDEQAQALRAAEPFLTQDALILVDDTNREAPRRATLEFLAERKGRYRLIWDVRTGFDGHPTAWNGAMLLRHVT